MSVATERRAQFRGRTESDAQPVSALQSAETILAVAEAAGSRHREALAASQTVVESMASVLRGEQSSFVAAHSSVTDLVKAHVTFASDAAAAKARAAYAEAALAASVQHRENASQVPSVFSEPDLAARLLSTAAADVTRQASRASAAETFAATAKVTHTGLSRALEVSTALQQQCSALRQRLALAESKCLASESANNTHEFEVIGLLRAVERLSSLCADADGLRSENQRMKGYLRNLEALLTPAQIMTAALPSDYKPPASFRVFSGAVPIVLKKEVPALFALRRMDEKELTLTDVLHEWISIGDQVGVLRDELASTSERANRDAARIAELEVEVVDERTRRVGAESHLKQVLSSRIDASTARHEMDQALYRLSLALDEKVALAATVARLTQQRDLALEDKAKLQGKLDFAEARLANRNAISDELTSLRLGYSRSLEALRSQIASIAAAANMSKQETETLTTRLAATEKTLVAVSKESEAVKQRLQTAERELDEATRRLAAESKRNAELERVCANASAAKLQQTKASPVQPSARTSQVLSTGLTTLHADAAKLEAELRTISSTIASVATLFATPPQTNVAAMQEALLLSAKVVDSTLRSAEQLRADVAERAVSDARRIDALTDELNASVRETHDLRKQLAETEAWAERAAVHVTETITGRSVPIEDARCAFCDLRANEAASDRAKAAEALSVAASMEQAVAQTEAAHAEAVAALQLKDIQIAALQRQVEWTTARVAHARQEAERLHLVRVELQRSLALTNEGSPANDDEVADVSEPVAPQVSDELRGILELLTGAVDQARQTTSQLLGTDQPRDDSNGEVQASNDEDAVQDAANETTSASRRNLSLIVKTLWEAAYATRSAGSDAPATQTAPNPASESATAENAALHERVKSLESQVEAANKTVEVQNKLIQHYGKTQAASPAAPAAVPAGPTQQELDAEKVKVASLEEKIALQTRLVDLLKHKIASLTEPKPAPQQPAQPAPQQ